jgi:hypothetical protein
MTDATFTRLLVNQITRGVITSVFGNPASAKQLQDALGTRWLTDAVKGLSSGTSCAYYFDRGGKAQTFQLCFDASHMLVLKQALKDSVATGSG